MSDATIYALASGPPRPRIGSGIAVIRVSGPGTAGAVRRLAPGATAGALPAPRQAVLRTVRDPLSGEAIDRGLVLWFPAPGSVTGEDYAEFHVHGGRAVIEGLLAALAALPGLRLAEPGAFARRSFENGKLDLTAAEGIADLVAAETAAQRRQALRQLEGELGRLYDGWRERLLRALAHVEAAIDYPDEDLPDDVARQAAAMLGDLRHEMAAHLADQRGERLRDGLAIAIVGAPNVGKSSLLNRLARRDAAIVSAFAGTTRDAIEVHLDLGGWPVTLIDTAGLRESDDPVEREGVRRARERARAADLRLHVAALGDDGELPDLEELARSVETLEAAAGAGSAAGRAIVAVNKLDLATGIAAAGLLSRVEAALPGARIAGLSAVSGDGISGLVAILQQAAHEVFETGDGAGAAEAPPLTQHRHREALARCCEALDRALVAADAGVELLAEDLRIASRELGRITGRVGVEDILDIVFRDFCIGK